ncbi:uncharacterized protein LOC127284455 [Leptopilina boulardi]|uniref:uncharacterized protein LOC127284455 n=1 Tax=Leptopilina boulardi TaxID=63433 RepID=UPI0021F6398C|nr:uncharacterized protein LOC127284455 [Leptopilina boulardi]XP_051165852.1 uncharacterized protein LOC127284455 [Leptopilina boulardi]XP_051165854.1 uncharacterized protein LOC127284455 [Leptopilina boulardi]
MNCVTIFTLLAIFLGCKSYTLRRECFEHHHCPDYKPACFDSICMNLCEDSCGINTVCKLRERVTPVCYCMDGMIGDPFIKCWKHEDWNNENSNQWGESSQESMELISAILYS